MENEQMNKLTEMYQAALFLYPSNSVESHSRSVLVKDSDAHGEWSFRYVAVIDSDEMFFYVCLERPLVVASVNLNDNRIPAKMKSLIDFARSLGNIVDAIKY